MFSSGQRLVWFSQFVQTGLLTRSGSAAYLDDIVFVCLWWWGNSCVVRVVRVEVRWS